MVSPALYVGNIHVVNVSVCHYLFISNSVVAFDVGMQVMTESPTVLYGELLKLALKNNLVCPHVQRQGTVNDVVEELQTEARWAKEDAAGLRKCVAGACGRLTLVRLS